MAAADRQGQVASFWTSLVDVPSLGLLLGRDFLEAVGADISFLRHELRCERLDGQPIALCRSRPAATGANYMAYRGDTQMEENGS